MRGQTAFEYLLMFSIVLAILLILTYYAQDITESNKEDIISANAVIAVNKIVEAADIVYTQGSPSQITLSIYIPDNVNSIQFVGNDTPCINGVSHANIIDMKINTGNATNDIWAISKGNFTCDSFIPKDSGTKRIVIKSEGSYVNVTES
jgi:uncharacterized protein (UPF0333 family)